MQRDDALALLNRLHSAQNHFYSGGGDAALRKVLSEQIAWHVPGRNAIADTYRGIEAVLGYFTRRRKLADFTLVLKPGDVLTGDGDQIAALTTGSAVIDGRERTWSTIGLYRITAGRITSCHLLPLDPREFDQIWELPGGGLVTRSRLRVRPRHCDAQGIMHASRYYEYFEDAFLDWLDTCAGGYSSLRASGTDLVVAASGCEHRRGPALGDLIEIETRPSRAGRTSITMSFTIRLDGEILANGRTTYVAVRQGTPTPLPDALRATTGQDAR
jgi:YbgC/YbaW family acyl-CoA thioester hydrolase